MNYLNKRLPKDVVYIILDFAKDKTQYNKVIGEINYKIRQLLYNLPYGIVRELQLMNRYLPPEEYANILCEHKRGIYYIRLALRNNKLYYFG